ncbi:DUF817 domain-containing protein [Lysobacter panacisoli]|uniref:DUF817 domain-containing protein n=1 Tax=Lysobacter panacisoli TaxID=1255263 RepID=A0ABP9LD87_9GAMM|nr:DUF817 domain-containing protein [Lysobacter panacisoli]
MEHALHRFASRLLARHRGTRAWRFAIELLVFGARQGWSCLFGGILLVLILATRLYWPEASPIARYDALFVMAVLVQLGLLVTRLEQPSEAGVILVFHIVGTAMEVFKTHMGSWSYPEANFLRLGGVPLFSGFMYAAVGSYMARVYRVFDIRLDGYPRIGVTVVLAAAIYGNFFAHHFLPDLRWLLFAATGVIFGRVRMHYRALEGTHSMPLLLAFGLVAMFIWLAENIATWSSVWLYPNQLGSWSPVGLGKLGSWYLLMIISVVLVTLVHPPECSVNAQSREDGGDAWPSSRSRA